MAQAEQFESIFETSSMAVRAELPDISGPHGTGRTGTVESADIETATACEERAQRLALRLSEVEDSIRLAQMYLSATRAIEDILLDTRRLLEKGRTLSEPASRKALSDTFMEIKRQVDDIAAEAGHDGQNLAGGDSLKVAFDEDDSHFHKVAACAVSAEALGLRGAERSFENEADIIASIMDVEHAVNAVRTRHTVMEMTLSLLEGRARFGRDRIQSLRNTSRLLLAEDKAYGAVCGIAARRVEMNSRHTGTLATDQALQANGITANREPVPDGPSDDAPLEEIAKDLARLLKRDSYLTNWFKFEAGNRTIFTRLLAESYGPDLIKASKTRYADDEDFRSIADRYMRAFEKRIEAEARGKSDRQAAIDRLLMTNEGTVYVVLSRARNDI